MAVRFTEEQRACVEQLAGPVDITAGAGSGQQPGGNGTGN